MTEGSPHPSYRPDIDGLRAVAVLAVLGFHAFPGSFRGGFAGVDVFFVISGFLISTILFTAIDRGAYSITDFYVRRVKRIFPALATVLAACLVVGWFVLLPTEYRQLGEHVAGGAAFVSNLLLWRESGYFDGAAATKVLLHLWSLGIEEQFYIVWPLLLRFAPRRHLPLFVGVVFLGSFVANLAMVGSSPTAAFYSPITRFWELLVGGALAYATLHGPALRLHDARAREGASVVGLLMIAGAIFFFDGTAPFPGWRALVPTFGALLVIAAGPRAFLNRTLLGNRAAVAVGLISYPLYLWHWPLLTFARIVVGATPSPSVRIAAVLAGFLLAWLTYRLVETPVRGTSASRSRTTVNVLSVAMAVLFALGVALAVLRGVAGPRGPWNVANIAEPYDRRDQFTTACRSREGAVFAPRFDPTVDFCHSTPDDSVSPDVVVLGDSHAGRIYSGLRLSTNLSVLDLGRASCLPFEGYEASNPGHADVLRCSPTMGNLVERIVQTPPRVVVLSAFFVRPYDGRLVSRSTEPLPVLAARTLAKLAARVARVVVVLDIPELPFDPSVCVERPFSRTGTKGRCPFDRKVPDQERSLYEGDLRRAAAPLSNVVFFDPASVLCDQESCFAVADGNLLYDDTQHLSRSGAGIVARALEPRLR